MLEKKSARDALTSAAARLDAAARTADDPETAALYREAGDSLWGLIWEREDRAPDPEKCGVCVGTGKIGPIVTSLESSDAIDRMTEQEKDRWRVVCPLCHGTGNEHPRGFGDTHLRPSDPVRERHMPTWVSRGAL